MDTLLLSSIVVPGRIEDGSARDRQKARLLSGLRTAAPHNSAGTLHINANENGIMQCTTWVAVHGSPVGATWKVFLLRMG